MEPKLVLLVWAMWVTLSVIIFWEKVTPSQLLLTSNPTIAKDSQNQSQLRELHAKWQNCLISWFQVIWFRGKSIWANYLRVILCEIEFFCQFITLTNSVNSGKFMDNCWIACQVKADMKIIKTLTWWRTIAIRRSILNWSWMGDFFPWTPIQR